MTEMLSTQFPEKQNNFAIRIKIINIFETHKECNYIHPVYYVVQAIREISLKTHMLLFELINFLRKKPGSFG